MSRSFKKYTIYTNNKSYKKDKRIMNHLIHNAKELKNGGHYKKISSEYFNIIIDKYDSHYYLNEIVKEYIRDGDTIEDAYIIWIKDYYYK